MEPYSDMGRVLCILNTSQTKITLNMFFVFVKYLRSCTLNTSCHFLKQSYNLK